MKYINQPVIKKDAYALLSGKPVYTDDLAPADCLVIKLLRSPHAHARIKSIDTGAAKRIPGVEAIFTYKDVPASRFTLAGQTYPEPSPYDRLILDEVVRYVGDEVAIIVAKNEASALQAMKLIRVEYEVYDAVLDFTKALDHPVIVHAEEDYKLLCEIGNERLRNLHSHDESIVGDVDQAFAECDVVLEREYHTKANAQAMMETFRSYAYMDTFDRLNVVSSTQVPFHIRRMVANALELPKSQIKVIKPRIGGGFGAKQTGCTEIFTAFVTWKLKKPCKLVYTREETFMASNSRHEMKMHVKIGAMKDGEIRAIDLYTLSNTGAYGEHGSTTVGLSGHKSLPIYNHVKASRFVSDVVYTNTMTAGAYRGYGATQGQFAVESAVNELADTLHIDPCELRLKNMVQEDEVMKQYYGGTPYIPNVIMTQEEIEDAGTIADWLSSRKKRKVTIITPKKGDKEKMVELAHKNALMVLTKDAEKIKLEEKRTTGAMKQIADWLGLASIRRAEAYDISNTSGVESVGSMVVFEDGRPKKNDYRKFRIKTVKGPDDYKSMREVLTRRFTRGMRERAGEEETRGFAVYPDLIMMDGGRGQVNIALEVLAELHINIPVCGMVKDDNHNTRGLYYNNVEIPIDRHSEGFKLITRVQDEAHRFAIEYHRSLRSKKQVSSVLDEIEGIGPARRKALMKHFLDIDKIRNANVSELMEAEGITENVAQNIYKYFH